MDTLLQLVETERKIASAKKELSHAKHHLSQLKREAVAFCPAKIGDKIPMDKGGWAEVVSAQVQKITPGYILFAVGLTYNDEPDFMVMRKNISKANQPKTKGKEHG